LYQEVRGKTLKQGEQISRRKSSSRFDFLLVLCPKPLRSGADVRQILKRKSGQAGSSDGHPYLRTRRLELYVSPQEFELIDGNRKSVGFHTIAQFIRSQATSNTNEQNTPQQHKAFLKCAFELNKIGVNLNQIAKHLNQGLPLTLSVELLLRAIKEQTEALSQEMRKWNFK